MTHETLTAEELAELIDFSRKETRYLSRHIADRCLPKLLVRVTDALEQMQSRLAAAEQRAEAAERKAEAWETAVRTVYENSSQPGGWESSWYVIARKTINSIRKAFAELSAPQPRESGREQPNPETVKRSLADYDAGRSQPASEILADLKARGGRSLPAVEDEGK